MKKPLSRFATLAFLASIQAGGCAGSGGASFKRVEVGAHKSVIYVYRDDDACQSDKAPEVYLDSAAVGRLENGGYLAFRVEPKVHTLKIKEGEMDLGMYVDPAKGEEKFVKWTPVCQAGAGTKTIMANINEVGSQTALQEIAGARLSK